MRKFLSLFGALALFALSAGPVDASCTGLFPAGYLCGNSGASPAIPAPFNALPSLTTSQIYGGTGGAGVAQHFPAGTGVETWLQTPTSANLAAAMTNETGSGSLVFSNSPVFTTPNIGSATGHATLDAPAASPTFTGTITAPDSGTWGSGGVNGSAIGGVTPAAGAFTTLAASGAVSGSGFSTYLASPPAIGGSAPAAGSFTTLAASSTVSGTGFSTYLASPPAIGGSAPAAGSFTNLGATGTLSGKLVKANGASTSASPTAPASSIAFKMQGLAGSITPSSSGNVLIIISGTIIAPTNTTVDNGIIYQISYGTGGAPANAAALTGTQVGLTQEYTSAIAPTAAADVHVPFSISYVVTGLTPGTPYWIDLAAEVVTTASAMALSNVMVVAFEQ